MQIEELLGKIEELQEMLSNISMSNRIAVLSVLVSISALIVTVIFNVITRMQYIKSLDPLLSFSLYEDQGKLFLQVENTGKSPASLIQITFGRVENNGRHMKTFETHIFKRGFTLFPNEKIQDAISFSGRDIKTAINPSININVRFIKGNTKKQEKYERTITFTNESNSMGNIILFGEINALVEEIRSVSYSINRMTNYFEGRCLYKNDKEDALPASSLYKDMRDAINNIERKDDDTSE